MSDLIVILKRQAFYVISPWVFIALWKALFFLPFYWEEDGVAGLGSGPGFRSRLYVLAVHLKKIWESNDKVFYAF